MGTYNHTYKNNFNIYFETETNNEKWNSISHLYNSGGKKMIKNKAIFNRTGEYCKPLIILFHFFLKYQLFSLVLNLLMLCNRLIYFCLFYFCISYTKYVILLKFWRKTIHKDIKSWLKDWLNSLILWLKHGRVTNIHIPKYFWLWKIINHDIGNELSRALYFCFSLK